MRKVQQTEENCLGSCLGGKCWGGASRHKRDSLERAEGADAVGAVEDCRAENSQQGGGGLARFCRGRVHQTPQVLDQHKEREVRTEHVLQ